MGPASAKGISKNFGQLFANSPHAVVRHPYVFACTVPFGPASRPRPPGRATANAAVQNHRGGLSMGSTVISGTSHSRSSAQRRPPTEASTGNPGCTSVDSAPELQGDDHERPSGDGAREPLADSLPIRLPPLTLPPHRSTHTSSKRTDHAPGRQSFLGHAPERGVQHCGVLGAQCQRSGSPAPTATAVSDRQSMPRMPKFGRSPALDEPASSIVRLGEP